jgi:hypothetical protein
MNLATGACLPAERGTESLRFTGLARVPIEKAGQNFLNMARFQIIGACPAEHAGTTLHGH